MTSTLRDRRTGTGEGAYSPNPSDAQFDLLADFRSELQQLSSTQRELLHELRSDGGINLDAEELPRLRQENAELRSRVAQLERMQRAAPTGDDTWAEHEAEYEKLLDQKAEVIRGLHAQLQELKEGVAPPCSAAPVHDSGLDQSKQRMDEGRAQLEEDEASMMQQMRTMEMSLAKDRAELARQRTELQRQQADFARDVDLASRDPELHDRLASLRRRSQENVVAGPAAPATTTPVTKNSGLIRRIFG